MAARPDPAGVFASDTHRRVLGSLSTPDAGHGWEVAPLLSRLDADPFTAVPAKPEAFDLKAEIAVLGAILNELAESSHAKAHRGGVWRMTQAGFAALTGPITDEPGEGVTVIGPDNLGPLTTAAKATPIGN